MLECGARFANNFYSKLSIDPDSGDATVEIEIITNEGVKQILTGAVVWDEGGDGDGLG